jgi:hypothetical protein
MTNNNLNDLVKELSPIIYPITLNSEDQAIFMDADISKSYAAELYQDAPMLVRNYIEWCEPRFDSLMARVHKNSRTRAGELGKTLLTLRDERNGSLGNYLFENLNYYPSLLNVDLSAINKAYTTTRDVFDQQYKVVSYRTKYGRYELKEFFSQIALPVAIICHNERRLQEALDTMPREGQLLLGRLRKSVEAFKQFVYLTEQL